MSYSIMPAEEAVKKLEELVNQLKNSNIQERNKPYYEAIQILAKTTELVRAAYTKKIAKAVDMKKSEVETTVKSLIEQIHAEQKEIRQLAENTNKQEETKPAQIDKRFTQPDLLEHIYKELDKTHKLDEKEKLALFLVRSSAELPDDRDHCSAALKGNSSSGKDNIIDTVLRLFPEEDSFKLTRGTQAALEQEANKAKQ